jgi:hypothetical protein
MANSNVELAEIKYLNFSQCQLAWRRYEHAPPSAHTPKNA